MTIELEEEFFKAFGIEPKKLFSARQGINPNAVIYPEITDRVLLELICIANKASIEVVGETVEETKNKLLEDMIY